MNQSLVVGLILTLAGSYGLTGSVRAWPWFVNWNRWRSCENLLGRERTKVLFAACYGLLIIIGLPLLLASVMECLRGP